jgi:hypothetical protein
VLRSEREKASFPSLPTMERMRRSKRPDGAECTLRPGATVCFHALSGEDTRRILHFLQTRAPLFFDD